MLIEISIFILTYFVSKIVNLYRKRLVIHKRFVRLGIAGPKPSLLFGNMSELVESEKPHEVIDKWIDLYGNCFGYFIGDVSFLVINDLDAIHQILVTNSKHFNDRVEMVIDAKPFIDSILGMTGQRWKHVRRVISPVFSNHRITSKQITDTVTNCVNTFLNYIDQQHSDTPVIDVGDRMQAITMDIICRTALNMNDNTVQQKNDPLMNAVKVFMETSTNCVVTATIVFPFLKPVFTFINNYMTAGSMTNFIIKHLNKQINLQSKQLNAETDENLIKSSLLNSLLIYFWQKKITREELIGNAHVIMIAGYETTSTGLTFALYLLAKHQHIQDKLRQQILVDANKSTYLDMVWNESLRLYPPVIGFLTRKASEDCVINDITIEKNTIVQVPVWHIHHDPNIWPNPYQFDPQRFSPENRANIPKSAFLTYGLGPRTCVGSHFANHTAKLVLSIILRKYRLEMCSETAENLTVRCPTVIILPSQAIHLKFVAI